MKHSLAIQSDQNHSTSFTFSESLVKGVPLVTHYTFLQWLHITFMGKWHYFHSEHTSTLIAQLTSRKIICLHLVAITSRFHVTFSKLMFLIYKVIHNFNIIKGFFLTFCPTHKSNLLAGWNISNSLNISSLISKNWDVFLFHILE